MAEYATVNAADIVAKAQYALDNKWGYIWDGSGEIWTQACVQGGCQVHMKTAINMAGEWPGAEASLSASTTRCACSISASEGLSN